MPWTGSPTGGQLQVYRHRGFWQAMDTLARQEPAGGFVAARRSQVEGVGVSFWAGKRVLLTGHAGFKGSWMSLWLLSLGAKLTGYALAPEGSRAVRTTRA